MASKRRNAKAAAEAAQVEEHNFNSLKKEISSLRRKLESSRDSNLVIIEAVKEVFSDNPPILTVPERPTPDRRNGRFHNEREIAVLHISDLHVGKRTRSYDSDVAEKRMNILINKTVEVTNTRRHWAKVDEIRVYLGGDMIEGEQIFPHQPHLIDTALFTQAVKRAPSILSKAILRLAGEFSKVHVCCVPGNHGRNGSKHAGSAPQTNWDSVAYEVTKLMVNGTPNNPNGDISQRVTWDLPGDAGRYSDWFTVDRVFDWGNMIIHGHEITGGFGGFPWYGVGRRASGWKDTVAAPWDYLYLGHFHTMATAELQHRSMLANGRFDTDDQHGMANFGGSGCPGQRLAFYSEALGLISDSTVFLDKRVSQLTRMRETGVLVENNPVKPSRSSKLR